MGSLTTRKRSIISAFYLSISNARLRKIKEKIIWFSFDTLFIFDFNVCVGTEGNLMLIQEVA